jgi:phage shock protein PspC (stress-responsive transcriptional regulator)
MAEPTTSGPAPGTGPRPGPGPGPAPGSSGARRRLRRDTDGGVIGGVAAGLARHLDVDVAYVRIAFVLAAVLSGGGPGILAYLIAWIAIPSGDAGAAGAASSTATARTGLTGDALPERLRRATEGRTGAFWFGVALVVLGGFALLDTLLSPLRSMLWWGSLSELLLPLALITVGVLVWRSSQSRGPTTGTPPLGETQVARATDSSEQRATSAGDERVVDDTEARSTDEVERFEERVERFAARAESGLERFADEVEREIGTWSAERQQAGTRIGRLTFGLAMVTLGVLWLLGSLGVLEIGARQILAVTLLVVGLGLLVSSFFGRGRGLIAAGLVLAPLVVLLALTPRLPLVFDEDGPVVVESGDPAVVRPSSVAALGGTLEFGVGAVVVDLRDLDVDELVAAGVTALDVRLGVGDLRILLPADVTTEVRAELGIGQIELVGRTSGGFGVSAEATVVPAGADAAGDARLLLLVEQGIGRITVVR